MDKKLFLKTFWKEYIILEKEFMATDEYVTINRNNYGTFSAIYTHLILQICSVFDSLALEYCKLLGYSSKNIVEKFAQILDENPNLKDKRCSLMFPYGPINIVPFNEFNNGKKNTDWWQAYNKIRHEWVNMAESGRPNYQLGNLKNALYAICGLFYLMLFYLK